MQEAENAGFFDDMFTGECIGEEQTCSREALLSSIHPNMRLFMSFFKKIYGYEITTSGFTENALYKMEKAGCSRARDYYTQFVTQYEKEQAESIKPVAEWYRKLVEEKYKREEVKELRKHRKNNCQQETWESFGKLLGFQLMETEN